MYGPWHDGSPAATSDVPTRPAPNATLPNTSPVWKRRRVSEGNQGRRASKTTRACDACKAKKARCSGMKPCTTCSEKNIECSYDSQYLRGRPPTPPSSTPEASTGDHSTLDPRPAAVPATAERHKLPLRHQQSSPEPESSDVHGQYIDPTCGLSFLQRAQHRLKRQTSGGSASNPERWNQPLTTAGDKPLLGARDGSNAGYNSHPLADLPSGAKMALGDVQRCRFSVTFVYFVYFIRSCLRLWLRGYRSGRSRFDVQNASHGSLPP